MQNKAKFISIAQFKEQTGFNSLEVKHNPKTEKDFVVLPNGGTMRCQNGIDNTKPMQFILDLTQFKEDQIMEACLINYDDSKGATTKFSI